MTAPRPSPAAGLIQSFLDAMAAERGASRNTLDAYRRDLDDYCGLPRQAEARSARRDRRRHLRLPRRAHRRRPRACFAGAAALLRAAIPQASLCRTAARRRSEPDDRRPAPRPAAAQDADRRRGGEADRHRARRSRRAGAPGPPAPRRRAARLPDRARLRVGPARLRADGAAEIGGADQGIADRRARQGRQGAAGADLRAGEGGDAAPIASGSPRSRRARRRVRGCFPPTAKAAI